MPALRPVFEQAGPAPFSSREHPRGALFLQIVRGTRPGYAGADDNGVVGLAHDPASGARLFVGHRGFALDVVHLLGVEVVDIVEVGALHSHRRAERIQEHADSRKHVVL